MFDWTAVLRLDPGLVAAVLLLALAYDALLIAVAVQLVRHLRALRAPRACTLSS